MSINLKEIKKKFNFKAMVFSTLCRYCNQLILTEIFDLPFSLKKEYKYFLSEDEIGDLGLKNEDEIIFNKRLCINFDFEISVFKKLYKGIIVINTSLINNGSFENSYYLNEIEIICEKDFKLTPFFLTERGMKTLISEFIHKLWSPILLQLIQDEYEKELELLNEIKTPILDIEFKKIIKLDKNQELVFDVFYIVCSYIYNKKKLPLCISATDIMKNRGLIQNKNANGYRGGYKIEQKMKIHASLNILNSVNLLNVNEISQFNYIIFPNKNLLRMPIKTLTSNLVKFNYKTQLGERIIANYLINLKKEKIKIKDLVGLIQATSKSLKPMQIRDKLENIMDELCEKKIIQSWYYLKIDEEELSGKNWITKWLELFIICRY